MAFLGLTIGLAVCEAYLRSTPDTTIKYYENDIYGSALTPNQSAMFVAPSKEYKSEVSVNSHGWPDTEHAYNKPQDVTRELIIGDSFVENFQLPYESRFFRQLQNKLGENNEVIAMGRGNTGTGPQHLILKNYGLKYNPDIVIHMFFEGNDVKNNSQKLQNDPYLPYFTINENGNLKQLEHTKKSYRKMAKLKDFLLNFRTTKLVLSIRQTIIENKRNHSNDYPTDYHVYDKNYLPEFDDAWKITKKIILETKSEVEKKGAKYILVAIPASEQIDIKKQSEIYKTYSKINPSEIDFEKPDKILTEFCQENSIECHFMMPYFKKYLTDNPNKELYFFRDGHWNADGTNLTSEFLYTEVMKPLLDNASFDKKVISQN